MIPVGPFTGRLSRDPEFSYVQPSGAPRWSATVAVSVPRYNSQTRNEEVGALWIFLQVWGDFAEELFERNYQQGDELAVTGRLDQYTKTEGEKKDTKTHVVPLFIQEVRRKHRTASARSRQQT